MITTYLSDSPHLDEVDKVEVLQPVRALSVSRLRQEPSGEFCQVRSPLLSEEI